MRVYVVGFLFNEDLSRVALIRKARPDWQRGRLNGIGGKVEIFETPATAMRREFREETGLDVEHWHERAVLRDLKHDGQIHFFVASGPTFDLFRLKNPDQTEPVVVCQADHLPEDVLPNLRWLIPLVVDRDVEIAEVREVEDSTHREARA